jgi:hypothetical protein
VQQSAAITDIEFAKLKTLAAFGQVCGAILAHHSASLGGKPSDSGPSNLLI